MKPKVQEVTWMNLKIYLYIVGFDLLENLVGTFKLDIPINLGGLQLISM